MSDPSNSRFEFRQSWANLHHFLTRAVELLGQPQQFPRESQMAINEAEHYVQLNEFGLASDLLVHLADQQSVKGEFWLSVGLAAKCMEFEAKSRTLLQRFQAGSLIESERDALITAAMREIAEPVLGVTEQFFSIHQATSDPIAHLSGDGQKVSIWIRIQDEPFYWVQQLSRNEEQRWDPLWGYCSHHANVYLTVSHPAMHPEEITRLLGIEPDRTSVNGTPITQRDGSSLFDSHRWYLNSPAAAASDFECQLVALLSAIKPFEAELKALQQDGSCGINAAMYDSVEYPYGFHLNAAMIASVAAAGLSIDFDVYHSGPTLP